MARPSTGSVAWKGNPARWFARVTTHDERGVMSRPWVDLERPDLKNTPEDRKKAKAEARRFARRALLGEKFDQRAARNAARARLQRSHKAIIRQLLQRVGVDRLLDEVAIQANLLEREDA